MDKKISINILRVFTNKEKKFGNPVGIILDEKNEIKPKDRQRIASKLGFSESVFINNLNAGRISIFNPLQEVKFAGHALVGTSYFLNNVLHVSVRTLDCKGGKIKTWQRDNLTWINAVLTKIPPWHHEQLKDKSLVDNLSVKSFLKKHTMVWAWINHRKGIVRARTFASDWGIPEDEANVRFYAIVCYTQ